MTETLKVGLILMNFARTLTSAHLSKSFLEFRKRGESLGAHLIEIGLKLHAFRSEDKILLKIAHS